MKFEIGDIFYMKSNHCNGELVPYGFWWLELIISTHSCTNGEIIYKTKILDGWKKTYIGKTFTRNTKYYHLHYNITIIK